jgi:hypothetical protein
VTTTPVGGGFLDTILKGSGTRADIGLQAVLHPRSTGISCSLKVQCKIYIN